MSQALAGAAEHVVATELEAGEGVLIDLDRKLFYVLNETAMHVWKAIEQGRDGESVVAELTGRYDVSPERARESVSRVIGELEARSLVTRKPA